jgi:outer membrane protein assembly factor BamB
VRRLLLACALAVLAAPASALADGACDKPADPAGEWPSYGHDLSISRSQPAEKVIGTANAGALKPAFVFEAPGFVQGTPIVDGGCMFVFSQGSNAAGPLANVAVLTALDAKTGAKLWSTPHNVGRGAYGGAAVGSPALFGDLVIASISKEGAPYLAAFDRNTGEERWRTTIDQQPLEGTNASPVVYNGMVLQGFFGNADADRPGKPERGGFVVVDAATGELLKKTFVIPDADYAAGYAGAGVWSTAAVDTKTGFAYAGTSNPHNPHHEHERSNSLIKIDLNRASAKFGEIVASYKGVHDTVVPGAQDQPVCETKEDVYYYASFSATCLAVDVDFGASPNRVESGGKTLVGGLQKAGVYHIVDTAGMSGVSQTPLGVPCFTCNAASPAFSDGHAFVAAGPPGQMASVDVANGLPSWAAPIGGVLTFNPVSVANGVVWTSDAQGYLHAYDQASGMSLVRRNMADDTGAPVSQSTSAAGVAIAHNTVYAAAKTFVIAYRPA